MEFVSNVTRVRQLIAAGHNDFEIAAQLQAEREADADFGWPNPRNTLRSLALTMRRAVNENRVVGAHEVLEQLTLFRRLWEEVAASGDAQQAGGAVLPGLAPVAPAQTVSQAFQALHADMVVLSSPAQLDGAPEAREARAAAERRYRRFVGTVPVICCARAGAAVADTTEVLFEVLGRQSRYAQTLSEAVLAPCLPLLLVHRATWQELLRDVSPAHFPVFLV